MASGFVVGVGLCFIAVAIFGWKESRAEKKKPDNFGRPIAVKLDANPHDRRADELRRKGLEAENKELEEEARRTALEKLAEVPAFKSTRYCPKCDSEDLNRRHDKDFRLGYFKRVEDPATRSEFFISSRYIKLRGEVLAVSCNGCGFAIGPERTADFSDKIRLVREGW